MPAGLPDYFFRTRDNGAIVFRVMASQHNRLEFDQIAVVNIRNGDIKPHGETDLSADDKAAIDAWMLERTQTLAARDLDDIYRTIDHLNSLTQWAQSKASPEDLEAVTDQLLLTMHDLRTVLLRKKSDRMQGKA
ncbi:MAG: hypothetical protein ACWA40_10245 [Planktomarina sp.]